MNEKVRTYLIEVAKQGKITYYSQMLKDCNVIIDLDSPKGQLELKELLSDITRYEHNNKRPLLTSIAINKQTNDPGPGFYKLAEEFGFGSQKKLQNDFWGIKEADKTRTFWQNEENYRKFASLNGLTPSADEIEFFNQAELDFFKEWQLRPYDSEDNTHVDAKNFIMNTLWEKSIHLGEKIKIQLPDFTMEAKKVWHKLGSKEEDGKRVHAMQFKHYTWIKIGRNTNRGRQIYFTFGIDAHPDTEAFIYKIDYQRERGVNLTPQQIELCDSLIPATAKWNEIAFEDLVKQDWNSLMTTCVNFIDQHLTYYDAIISAVYGEAVQPTVFKNKLVRREKPKDGFESIPESKKEFKGVDVDFQRKAKDQKDLGDKGEALVKLNEIEFLSRKGLHDEAAKVTIVKDGEGYDVFSFDENGGEKLIEVKTTTGNQYAAFFLTDHEVDFMRLHPSKYCIYRVYHYDEENNFGEFYELRGDIESQLLMMPTRYKVLIRKET